LLALLLVWAWLRWRRSGGVGWALAMGAFAGWAAIVRPVDAVCYALPIGIAMLWELWRRPTGISPSPGTPGEGRGEGLSQAGEGTRMRVLALPAIVVGALPFLSLQLYFNHGVTGRLTQTPYTFYLERDQPGTSFGFHAFDPSQQAASALPQKRDYYNRFMKPYIRDHQPGTFLRTWANKSLPMIVGTTLPARVLLVFVPVGVLGLTNIRSRVLWASLPLFLIGYLLNTFFLEHYAAVIIPAVLLSVVLGVDVLAAAARRWRPHVLAGCVLVLVVIAVSSTYEFNPVATALDPKDKRHLHAIDDETFHSPLLRFAHEAEQMVERPAVILFRYTPAANIIEEPVYNTSVAWPDDAAVVRAHDLGPRNGEIFGYYAQRQPDRMFYRFDRATGTLTPLGRARDLAGAPATTRPTTGSAAR
jgi:hypothetical protein